MAGEKRERVCEADVKGLKYFDKLAPLLLRLHDVGCERDKAGTGLAEEEELLAHLAKLPPQDTAASRTVRALTTAAVFVVADAAVRWLGVLPNSTGRSSDFALPDALLPSTHTPCNNRAEQD